jgi:Flp pilus assembly protein TadG
VHLIRALKAAKKESGQVLVLFGLWMPVLLLFSGMAIDFGFGFLTKLRLAKASDAAALAVMRNLGQGDTAAAAIGQSIFSLNINSSSHLFVTAPAASITFSTSGGEPVVNVASTATIRTVFIWLAGFPTLAVADTSQATRPPVLLSLVLDKSGSMNSNGGAQALPPSVLDFLSYFINGTDELSEVSFSTLASTDVPISTNFQTPITNYVNGMSFSGATYAWAGLNNAGAQIASIASPPANAQKVVVFFTDGWANTNNDIINGVSMNYGGDAPAEFSSTSGIFCMNPTTGADTPSPPYGVTAASSITMVAKCNGQNWFPATDTGPPDNLPSQAPMDMVNIATEADYRAVKLANSMRALGYTVYSIGLGDKINNTYLMEVANAAPYTITSGGVTTTYSNPDYNSSEPVGLAEFAPTSSDLDAAFQTIASKILLRITH